MKRIPWAAIVAGSDVVRRHAPYLRILVFLTLSACADTAGPSPEGAAAEARPRPVPTTFGRSNHIVVLESGADVRGVARDHGIAARFEYRALFRGFAAPIPEAARAALSRDSRVAGIYADQDFMADGGSEATASWGLDRIDQRTSDLNGLYSYQATGEGVTVYIVDTGIRYSHNDFGNRAVLGFDAFGGDGADCHGHGTHVAGTVGGRTWGVAKEVDLVSVRVLDCGGRGTTSEIIAGLDWIAANARRPAVINMSLGGGANVLMDDAVRRIISAGVPAVLSAGNYAMSACYFSPGRVAEGMTIGASDAGDQQATFSNYGECVDWFAPGVSILSAGAGSDDATATKSGTSMASPHTAGVAALYLQANPGASASQVATALHEATTKRIIGQGGQKADLLYSVVTAAPPDSNEPPTVSLATWCTQLLCGFEDTSTDPDGVIVSRSWNFGDGATSLEQNPTHTYAGSGTYQVSLTVTDDDGASATTSRAVTVSGDDGEGENAPPVAEFSATCVRLRCDFADSSSDPDGQITRWEWDFGDGATSVLVASTDMSHTFDGTGSYEVRLRVMDDAGATTDAVRTVQVGLPLTVVGYRQKGKHFIDLNWSGAGTPQIQVFLNGILHTTVDNTGTATLQPSGRGQVQYTVRICETGSGGICSPDVDVSL